MQKAILRFVICVLMLTSLFFALTSCSNDNFEGLVFEDATFMYDGLEHSISVFGAPEDATVTYSPSNTQTEAGTYEITAKVEADGYNTETLTATMKIVHPDGYALDSDIAELIERLNTALSEATTANDSKINALKADYQAKIDALTASNSETQAELDTLRTTYTAKVAELEAAAATTATNLDTLKTNYETELAKLNAADTDNKNKIDALTERYDEEVAALQTKADSTASELAALKTNYETELAKLNAADTDNKNKIDALTERYDEEIAALQKKADSTASELDTLNSNYTAKVEELTNKISANTADINSKKNELQAQIDSLNKNLTTEINNINALIDTLFKASIESDDRLGILENQVNALLSQSFNGSEGLEFYPLSDGTYCVAVGKALFLEEIIIPSSYNGKAVTQFANLADNFQNCTNLKKITIPETITYIPEFIFAHNDTIVEFIVHTDNTAYRAIDGCLYSKSGDRLIKYASGKDTVRYTVPSSASTIADLAFYGAKNLERIVIPNVSEIGKDAFAECKAIEILYHGTESEWNTSAKNVTSTLDDATVYFYSETEPVGYGYYWHYLNDVVTLWDTLVPSDGLEYYIEDAFCFVSIGSCTDSKVVIPETYNGYPVVALEEDAFEGCDFITDMYIPDSVFWIETKDTFAGCTNLIEKENGLYYVDRWVIDADDDITEAVFRDDTIGIVSDAFEDCDLITDIDLPDSILHLSWLDSNACETVDGVTYIDNWALYLDDSVSDITLRDGTVGIATLFSDGYDFDTIKIPDSVKYIDALAFDSKTEKIHIGSGVSYIDPSAFYNCSRLSEITVDKNNPYYTSIDGNLYTKDEKTLVRYSPSRCLYYFYIPDSVTAIADFAFIDSEFEVLTIPEGVTYIGNYAFCGVSFDDIIYIPKNVKHIGINAFLNARLEAITVDTDNEYYKSSSAGVLYTKDEKTLVKCPMYNDCDSFTIPYGVETISDSAFHKCDFEKIIIPDSVKSIGVEAFEACDYLHEIRLPDSVTYIGLRAFYNCTGLNRIIIGNNVSYIGENAFLGCDNIEIYCKLTSAPITWDKNWHSGNNVIYGYIDSGVTNGFAWLNVNNEITIYDYTGGASVLTVPEKIGNVSVTTIAENAFAYCTSITDLTISEGIRSIEAYAFSNCTGIIKLTLPASVTNISPYAFYAAPNIDVINLASGNQYYKVSDRNLYTIDGGTLIIKAYVEPEWYDYIKYEETDILMAMTNCSNGQELSSGCERYLSGEGDYYDNIDSLISERNDNAYELTKVNVSYQYYPDVQELYGYSNARNTIYNEIMAASSATPDIYCNWMTDLLICSLQGCFANLYSRNYGEGEFQANNHFNLKNDGYMADLMGSLTLSTQKIYVVASDYFIDIIRSFYVIPVNVSLFNQIAPSMYLGVVNPTIDTFFDEVKPCDCTNYDSSDRCTDECADGGWTYDRLMQFSQQIYQSAGTSNTETIHDRLGFALGANGLPAAGLVYTSSVTIINKEWDAANNKYNYSYPATNQKLYDLVDKISDMMATQGVYFATGNDAAQLTYEGEKSALLGIRNQFVSDKMLFGGIVTLGSLEYQTYQNMKTPTRGGFGVVPVPVYEAGDNYLTQIHTVGRAGAIRFNTEKFVQCSAFLHYQSSNSKDILNEYFESTFTAADGDYMNGNVDMLRFIRANARTAFDKLFEDAIGFMYEYVITDSAMNRFHTLLANNGYQYDVSDKYEELYQVKSECLVNLENDYAKLPS